MGWIFLRESAYGGLIRPQRPLGTTMATKFFEEKRNSLLLVVQLKEVQRPSASLYTNYTNSHELGCRDKATMFQEDFRSLNCRRQFFVPLLIQNVDDNYFLNSFINLLTKILCAPCVYLVCPAEGGPLWSYNDCDYSTLTNSKAFPNKTSSPSRQKITK